MKPRVHVQMCAIAALQCGLLFSYSDIHLCAFFEQEEKEMLVAGKVAQGGAAMEDDQMSQVSELTGFNIGALAGSGLFAQGLTNSACFGSDDENANGSCGGGNASIAMSASYASSQASEAAKSRPATPEPGQHPMYPHLPFV